MAIKAVQLVVAAEDPRRALNKMAKDILGDAWGKGNVNMQGDFPFAYREKAGPRRSWPTAKKDFIARATAEGFKSVGGEIQPLKKNRLPSTENYSDGTWTLSFHPENLPRGSTNGLGQPYINVMVVIRPNGN